MSYVNIADASMAVGCRKPHFCRSYILSGVMLTYRTKRKTHSLLFLLLHLYSCTTRELNAIILYKCKKKRFENVHKYKREEKNNSNNKTIRVKSNINSHNIHCIMIWIGLLNYQRDSDIPLLTFSYVRL